MNIWDQWTTTCPKCGAADELCVVAFSATCRIPLHSDGFSTDEANGFDTEDEVVECDACQERFTLPELVLEED